MKKENNQTQTWLIKLPLFYWEGAWHCILAPSRGYEKPHDYFSRDKTMSNKWERINMSAATPHCTSSFVFCHALSFNAFNNNIIGLNMVLSLALSTLPVLFIHHLPLVLTSDKVIWFVSIINPWLPPTDKSYGALGAISSSNDLN